MFKKLAEVALKYKGLQDELNQPEVAGDPKRYAALAKQLARLEKIVIPYKEYQSVEQDIASNKELLNESDAELAQMAKEELVQLRKRQHALQEELKLKLLPQDPNDEKNIILEIRAGAGGDEAGLFAQELFRAYALFAAKNNWQINMLSQSGGNAGGFKEVIALCAGQRVYSRLKFESGVHRVQRVPKTESQGRVHTSTVTVVVLPEAEEVDISINPNDVRVDVYRSSGPGGQSVNTTDSAVRVTHVPTGLVVTCQDGKSQLSNKQQALKVLYSRLLDLEQSKQRQAEASKRLAHIGTGDRSERIRTYNFPQNRITDHRVGLSLHSLTEVLNGQMEELIEPVRLFYQSKALAESQGED